MSRTMSLIASGLTQPVLDGDVKIPNADFTVVPGKSVDGNSRQMLQGAFDVAEMSIATFLKAWDQGGDVIGLPIFTGRRFLQGAVLRSKRSSIRTPEDFRNKRVGLPQFWMTSSVWHRGILNQQHGVPQQDVTWYTAVDERFEGLRSPDGVTIDRLPEGRSLDDALVAGEIDAVMTPGRGVATAYPDQVTSPYPDLVEAQRAYFASTGVFPIMHFVVMKRSLSEQEPALVEGLFSAFVAAKQKAVDAGSADAPIEGLSGDETAKLFGPDPWRYGLAQNRRPLETFLQFAHGQGWVDRLPRIEDLFASPALTLEG